MTQSELTKLSRELAREVVRASEKSPNAAMNELILTERNRLDSEEVKLLKRLVAISES
jgi:hypothetical protein